ncbi:MAG: thiamine phosphate synthase [Candidatus Latescibacteria bacterium]|nr:thiamine phosphate synthase [Candidatus Latescibacterota bacterium]
MRKPTISGLYVITDFNLCRGRPLAEVVELAIQGGARVIQYREKYLPEKEMIKEGRRLRRMTQKYDVPLIINDNLRVAEAVGADGVHLGQTDTPLAQARQTLGTRKIIGISVSNLEQAIQAYQEGADYLGVGPVYLNKTVTAVKPDATQAIGLDLISQVKKVVEIPVVAIGGINRENAAQVLRAGADGIAIVWAVFASPDPQKAAEELTTICKQEGKQK